MQLEKLCARVALSVAALSALSIGPAQATNRSYAVTFNVKTVGYNAVTVVGDFTISFDPNLDYSDETTGISLKKLNINMDSSLGFTYVKTYDELVVGGIENGVGGLYSNTNDLTLDIANFISSPNIKQLQYTQYDQPVAFGVGQNPPPESLTVTPIPEPAAWALMLLGLGGITAAMRSRRRQMTPTG